MYFTRDDRGSFSTIVHNWPHDDVHVIVVTDGSRILGLGDLGAHGMGIPIGKLALYCAIGGIAPHRVLPILLDVGTDNQKLLSDPEYVGIRQPRLQGQEYFDMVDEFMAAVVGRWPDVVVQFEDFETSKAVPLLDKYREIYRCFNDDIQGTGVVALSGLMSAARNSGSSLTEMRVLCAGAGSAGLGVCAQLVEGMVEAGLTREEAMSRFVVCTHHGALGKQDGVHGDPNYKAGIYGDREKRFMNPTISDGTSLLDAMKTFRPTVLMGMTATAKVFSEDLIRTMAAQCERPIIMPMSNPTSKAECTAEEGEGGYLKQDKLTFVF
jgi:malate dehydrogenase (oxaloacetate-decarboxylating)(NADP+)